MRFVLNVDAELYYVTVHREDCPHAVRSDVRRDRRYWIRGPLRSLKAVQAHVDRQVASVETRLGKKLRPRKCGTCKPGRVR
jgi:hypothetical protein